jgi:hypothetical protein
MVALRMVVLAVRFLVELAMLTALAMAGAGLGDGATTWLLGIVLPIVAVLVWQAFVEPKARRPVPIGVRVAIELVLFAAAAWLLAAVGYGGWSLAFAIVAITVSVATAATERVRSLWDESARPG